jgi:hypothetical protein
VLGARAPCRGEQGPRQGRDETLGGAAPWRDGAPRRGPGGATWGRDGAPPGAEQSRARGRAGPRRGPGRGTVGGPSGATQGRAEGSRGHRTGEKKVEGRGRERGRERGRAHLGDPNPAITVTKTPRAQGEESEVEERELLHRKIE